MQMKIKHTKIYYVGGLISLIFLPILFFISTIGIREKAVSYGLIEVDVAYGYNIIPFYRPELQYVFLGNNEQAKLYNFQQFCQTIKSNSDTIYRLELPEICSYNFFIQVIDILQENKFRCGLDHRIIKFDYRPNLNFRQEYEPISIAEEFQYVRSEISKLIDSFKMYITGKPVQRIRILKYTDYGPPPTGFGSFYFSSSYSKIKEEPKSSIYFRTLSLWFVPIILLWMFLFILSIKRNNKLLPN